MEGGPTSLLTGAGFPGFHVGDSLVEIGHRTFVRNEVKIAFSDQDHVSEGIEVPRKTPFSWVQIASAKA